ncbi:MAG TPA: hypothetical protein VH592_21260 [Gemmataceae bacterium]|jgi:YesN/AraC family two-component response regulator
MSYRRRRSPERRSQEAGFSDYLVKPIELAALEKLLGELKDERPA